MGCDLTSEPTPQGVRQTTSHSPTPTDRDRDPIKRTPSRRPPFAAVIGVAYFIGNAIFDTFKAG